MSKPSVMRQDHGVAISFNASVTSGGGVIFFVGFTLYEKKYRFDEIDIKIIGDVIIFVTVYEKVWFLKLI